jgi:hypothetical protein|tara:strand:- start:592 stop:777 length:186 start_codon:yes stop_codon:yes gene_type:complete
MISKHLIKKAKYLATDGVNDTVEVTCNPDDWRYYVPIDKANTDYQKFLEWVAEGNTAEAAD